MRIQLSFFDHTTAVPICLRMFLRQLDLTTALRPSLFDEESLLFVQDGVGLYEGKFKIPNYQNGHAYLTSHRVCYVDNADPRAFSVAVDLKEIERPEFYAGFLKSSPKITLFPKPKRGSQAIRSPIPLYASPSDGLIQPAASPRPSPAPTRDVNATWICPICGLSNAVPPNFDPATANQYTTLPPCQACGIKPPLVHMVKAAIAAMSNRSTRGVMSLPQRYSPGIDSYGGKGSTPTGSVTPKPSHICPRCTFHNHPSLSACEICGASLQTNGSGNTNGLSNYSPTQRPESPGPVLKTSIVGDDTIETIKFSFRAGGEKIFLERLRNALVQRKWLLESAPPVPQPGAGPSAGLSTSSRSSTPQPRMIGIAGLERRGAELRMNNQTVIGSAFEDLEALMTSAKEVIAMAEQFAKQSGNTAETRSILSDSASALGLVMTKDMLSSGSASESLYITELARNLAEFLTDDRRGVLRKEGGIMSLVDLWAVFNRTRNGIELISPNDFEKAALKWDDLHLPIRLRRFKSGLLAVQERSRTDERTVASLLAWLREPQYAFPPAETNSLAQTFGRGVTAQETAERFGWSVGVSTEELEMAEELGALCRDQCLDGIRFWENHLLNAFAEVSKSDAMHMMARLSV